VAEEPADPRPKYIAAFEYVPEGEGELGFAGGEIIYVMERDDSGWWQGEVASNGNIGWFPANYVEEYVDAPPPPKACDILDSSSPPTERLVCSTNLS
jgi:hypothetical protein